jgi:predicted ATPase/DNA-binding SARP family transcriptional activator
MLTVAVLGPLELRRDGVSLAVPAGKTTEVLVRLALDAGALVRTERLIDDLWSDQSVGVARNTLQAKVSKLRRVLGAPGLVTGGSAGYTLHLAPDRVDALEVLRLAGSAAALRDTGEPAAVARLSATALAMFKGEILASAGDGGWLAPHRTRLAEARLSLTEDNLGARIQLGAAGEVIGELEGLVTEHPLRESLWRLLITALYRTGRQSDALAAYRRVRQRLADELGLDPGAELRALERQVLRHDESLAASVRAIPKGNLPALSASLVGRAADVAAVVSLVGAHRLVTVVGPAGVGKTRLAVEVAGAVHPPAGSWLVRLETAGTVGAVWQSVGAAFGLTEATGSMVLDRLRGLEALLVLDNCEHLVDQLAAVVGGLLGAATGLRVLVTSQLPLGLDGEVVRPLDPLSIVDSVALFQQRAAEQRRSFTVDDDTSRTIEAVCRSLDGLPLAIELAAARAKALSVREIARRLHDRFALLTDPTGRRPARHRALRAAIAWSYDLLFPDDQRGLWALACFAGGGPLAAAEEILAALGVPSAAALDVLGRLADRSLVGVEVDPDGAVRYRLLDSVRAYSLDRLVESGLAEAAHAAHAGWFAAAADRARHGVHGRDQAAQLSLVRAERANIDAALGWAGVHDPVLALRMANGFGWAWIVLGAGVDAAVRSRTALAAAGRACGTDAGRGSGAASRVTARDVVDALLFAGWFEASGGDVDRAVADVEEAIGVADTAGDAELRASGGLILAFVYSQQGRPHDALAVLAGCRPEFDRLGLAWEAGASWLLSAWAETALGATDHARTACDEALRLLVPIGDGWALSHAEALLGGLAQAEHRFADAAAHLARAADAARTLGFVAAEGHHLTNLGWAYRQIGDHRAAIAALERAVDAGHAAGDLRTVAMAQVRLGRVRRTLGDRPSARAHAESARRWYAAAGGGDGAGMAEHLLAALDADDNDPRAADRLTAVLTAARAGHDVEVELLTLDALARVRADQARPDDARAMLAAADAVLPAARHLVTDQDRIDRDRALSILSP